MFQGSSALLLDAKGRMTVPSRHRDALAIQCEGRLTLTRSPDGCLLLFPRPVWEVHRERIAALPMNARAWTRIFLGSACDVDMDTTGRILIAPELRQDGATVPTPTEGAVQVTTVASGRERRQRLGQHDRLVTVRGKPVYGLR